MPLTELSEIGREVHRIMSSLEQKCRQQKLSERFFPASTIDPHMRRVTEQQETGVSMQWEIDNIRSPSPNIDKQLRIEEEVSSIGFSNLLC